MARRLLNAVRMTKLAVLVVVAGCGLYFNGGHDCPGPGAETGIHTTDVQLRDPTTGTCVDYPTGSCDPQCGPCANNAGKGAPAGWATCGSPCEGLAESACLADAQCHAAYTPPASGRGAPTFVACWNMIATQPDPNVSCSGLDAGTCAEQHACGSLLANGTFSSCIATTPPPPACGDPGICYGTVQCTDAPPDCPPGTVAGITPQSGPELSYSCWSGYCIPTTKCPD